MKRYEVTVVFVMDADSEVDVTDGLHDTFELMEQRGEIADWWYEAGPKEVALTPEEGR